MADAEAICEAAQRPTMRVAAVKSKDQRARSCFALAIVWSGNVLRS